jgi:hypothetical protein
MGQVADAACALPAYAGDRPSPVTTARDADPGVARWADRSGVTRREPWIESNGSIF